MFGLASGVGTMVPGRRNVGRPGPYSAKPIGPRNDGDAGHVLGCADIVLPKRQNELEIMVAVCVVVVRSNRDRTRIVCTLPTNISALARADCVGSR